MAKPVAAKHAAGSTTSGSALRAADGIAHLEEEGHRRWNLRVRALAAGAGLACSCSAVSGDCIRAQCLSLALPTCAVSKQDAAIAHPPYSPPINRHVACMRM
jgi:hypothetical protein